MLCITGIQSMILYVDDIFSKNKTKVIPNKECIILTYNLLKLYISNQTDSSSTVFCKICRYITSVSNFKQASVRKSA